MTAIRDPHEFGHHIVEFICSAMNARQPIPAIYPDDGPAISIHRWLGDQIAERDAAALADARKIVAEGIDAFTRARELGAHRVDTGDMLKVFRKLDAALSQARGDAAR